jgi:hypothetical protein
MSSATREPRVGKSFGPRLSPAAEDLVGSFPLDWVTHPNTLVHSRYGRAGTLKPRWRRIEPRLPMHLLCSGRRSGPAQVVRAFLALDGTIVRSVDCTFAVFDETRNLRSFLPMHGRIARLKPSAPAVRSSWTQHSGVLPLFIVRRGARRIVRHELLVQHTGTASKTDLQVAPTSEMFCTGRMSRLCSIARSQQSQSTDNTVCEWWRPGLSELFRAARGPAEIQLYQSMSALLEEGTGPERCCGSSWAPLARGDAAGLQRTGAAKAKSRRLVVSSGRQRSTFSL